jgi:hypothetical protein
MRFWLPRTITSFKPDANTNTEVKRLILNGLESGIYERITTNSREKLRPAAEFGAELTQGWDLLYIELV